MSGFDVGDSLAERMRAHAGTSTHLYGELMRAMAEDLESGGPVQQICAGWEDAPTGSVVQLRLLAGLFRIVLTGRAPQLEPYYPCLGGTAPPSHAWPPVREVLAAHAAELHGALEIAPQTNEVGRSTALLVGLFEALRRTGRNRVRLLEPGASAGLNLLVDRFRFEEPSWSFGPSDAALVLTDTIVGGVLPVDFEVVSRRGCDLAPVDPASPDGVLRLRSFVWPFHVERHERLVRALQVAARHPVCVDQAAAGEWLRVQFGEPVDDDVLTVVWQSITRLYWPAEEIERVHGLVQDAIVQQPLAWISMEYAHPAAPRPTLTLSGVAPGGEPSLEAVTLADVDDHGFPVTMLVGSGT